MSKLTQPTVSMAIFWFLLFSALSVVWNLLPTTTSQVAVIIIFLLAVFLPIFGQLDLSFLTGLFLGLIVINFWVSIGSVGQLAAIGLTFVLSLVMSFLFQKIRRPEERLTTDQLIGWLLLAYFVAQINSVIEFYPIPFFDQSLLSLMVFYGLWLFVEQKLSPDRRSIIGNFIFLLVAVIVVLGSIIWANYPYLKIF